MKFRYERLSTRFEDYRDYYYECDICSGNSTDFDVFYTQSGKHYCVYCINHLEETDAAFAIGGEADAAIPLDIISKAKYKCKFNNENIETTKASLRSFYNVKRLSPAMMKEAAQIEAKVTKRIANYPPSYRPLPYKIAENANTIAAWFKENYPRYYRVSESSIGGNNKFDISCSSYPFARGDSLPVYGKKYSGTNAIFRITVGYMWLKNILAKEMAVIEDKIVTHATKVTANIYKVSYLEQSRGFHVTAKNGYIKPLDGTYKFVSYRSNP